MPRGSRTSPPQKRPANLAQGQVPGAIQKLERRLPDFKEADPGAYSGNLADLAESLCAKLDGTLVEIFGHDTLEAVHVQVTPYDFSVNVMHALGAPRRRSRSSPIGPVSQRRSSSSPAKARAWRSARGPTGRITKVRRCWASTDEGATAMAREMLGEDPTLIGFELWGRPAQARRGAKARGLGAGRARRKRVER